MLLTTRLSLAKQTHGDNVNMWDIPLNSNFQKIDDDLSDLATVLTGSGTGDWTDFQTNVLNDITYAGDSGLGDNPTETLAGRAHYDQEANLVSAPTFTVARKPQMRGGFFNDGAIVGSENSYAHNLGDPAISAAWGGATVDITFNASKPMDITIDGQKHRFNRSIAVTKNLVCNYIGVNNYFWIFATNKYSSLGASYTAYDAQLCRTSATTPGAFTTSKGGDTVSCVNIGIADAGEGSWQPKAGDILTITDSGNTYRFKIKARTGNDSIQIYGKFPKAFAAPSLTAWEIRDYRQPVYYIRSMPDGATSGIQSIQVLWNLGASQWLEFSSVSHTAIGTVVCDQGTTTVQFNNNYLAYYRATIGKKFLFEIDTSLSAGQHWRTCSMPIAPYGIIRGITFYIDFLNGTDRLTVYNPQCLAIDPTTVGGADIYTPVFHANIQRDAADGAASLVAHEYAAFNISINQDWQAGASDICCRTHTTNFMSPGLEVSCKFADIVSWGIIIDLDI